VRVVAGAQLVCASPNPVPWLQLAPGRGGFWSPYPQSTKHSQSGNPVWNETFDLPIADPAQDQIKFTLYDHAAQAQVGEGIVSLTGLRGPSTENEMWVPINSAQGPRGQIQVYMNPLNFGVGGGAMVGAPPGGMMTGHGAPPPGGMMVAGGPPPGGVMMTPPPQQQHVVMQGPPPQQQHVVMQGPPQQQVVMTGVPPPHTQQTVVVGGHPPGYGHPPGPHGHTVVVGGHGKFKKGKFKHKKFKHKKFKYKAPKIKLGKFKPKFKW
jgi:hypothetical protein